MPSGQAARGGLRLLRGRVAADRHRLAAPRRGALDQRPRARGRGRDRPRLARLFDGRSRAAGGDGALEGGARAAPRGAARHAALARPDRRGAGDAAAGRRRPGGARPRPHRGAPRRGGVAVPDQPGAGGATGTTPASPSSATSTASTSAAGRRPRTTCARSRPRPRRSAGRSSGWSGGRTWRGRRSRTARSRPPTRSPRGTSAAAAPNTPTAEWVAGFIALTRMDDPAKAVGHFAALPGRGGDADQPRARRLLARPRPRGRRQPRGGARRLSPPAPRTRRASTASSRPPRAGSPPDPALTGAGSVPDWKQAPFMRTGVVQAAYFLHLADDAGARRDLLPPRRRGQAGGDAGGAGADGDRPRPAADRLRIAKDAAAEGMVLPAQYYPLHADRRDATGRCRPSTRWRSPARSRSSTPRRAAASAPAG